MSGLRRLAPIAAVGAPGVAAAAWMLWVMGAGAGAGAGAGTEAGAPRGGLLALAVAAFGALFVAWRVDAALERKLRTVSSVLAAYREGDFSVRARGAPATALGDVLAELNQLGDVLRGHRLGEMEAWALLRKVLAEVDVIVLAVAEDGRIRLANDAAARSLGHAARDLAGESAESLGISALLEGEVPRVVTSLGPEPRGGGGGPSVGQWELRRGAFRLSGEAQTLIVLSDVSHALRDKERDAWRRIIRVMGHEINNSLTPIRSIAGSLATLVEKKEPDWEADLSNGLGVIARRAEALGRFMDSYAKLARLPPPKLARVHVPTLVRKIAALDTRVTVDVVPGPDAFVNADADQLEQALINLVKNAIEASLLAHGKRVEVGWRLDDRSVALEVVDDGPGVEDTANLFVPFFTTKPNGSGIGLALTRQILEAHGGEVTLLSRKDAAGAIARIRVPLLAETQA